MKQKIFAVCRHILYIGLVGGALFAIFIFSVVSLSFMFNDIVMDIIGEVACVLIYLVLPLAVASVCLSVKYILRWNFKKAIRCSVIGVLIYAVLALGVLGATRFYCGIFTEEKWSEYPYQRHWMIDDMTDKYQFIGMTRDEVIDILGKPDWSWDAQETDNSTNAEIGGTSTDPDTAYTEPDSKEKFEYMIEYIFIEHVMLVFELEDGKVTNAYTYNDEYRTLIEPLY